jgi:hypothetical protein
MMRLIAGLLVILNGAGLKAQDQAAELVKKLSSEDWVEQAQAAKDLAKMGPPVLEALRPAVMSDSPAAKYWASAIAEVVSHTAVPPPSLPLPVAPETTSTPNPKGFSPSPSDLGALAFICNNPSHGPYEVVIIRCGTCSKTRRFAYDYGTDCYRCAVCKKGYERADLKCDKCGKPPAPRITVRMKTQ